MVESTSNWTRRELLRRGGRTAGGLALGGVAVGGTAAARTDTFAEQLATMRSTIRTYRGVGSAKVDGYEFLDVLPPVGYIYHNPDFIGNLEFTEPPSMLFYAPLKIGEEIHETPLVLAGVEYHVAGDQTADPPDIFDDENASRELAVPEEEGWHRSPIPDVLDVTGLHVWSHLRNPEGIFHTGHPTIEARISELDG